MKLVISGASGVLGSNLVPLLRQSGHSLLLISRNPAELRLRYPDLLVASPDSWQLDAIGYDAFVHLAVLNNDRGETLESFFAVNADLTGSYAKAAKRAGIPRFIYPSTVLALMPGPQSHYVRSKIAGARQASDHYQSGLEVVFLGVVHGDVNSRALSFLNYLPRFGIRHFFAVLSAFKPTTAATDFARYIIDNKSLSYGRCGVLTDSKAQNRSYRAWQMILNWSFSIAVAMLTPGLAVIWLLILSEDGHPGLFVQNRIGEKQEVFRCYKLRTMRWGTESEATHLVSGNSITRFGRILRRLKIDELPQAINVLRGEMNLIGPRPCLPSQHEVIRAREEVGAFNSAPGITGWAQVNGVNMRDPEQLASLDEQYFALRCISLDFYILLKTLFPIPPPRREANRLESDI